MTLSAGRPLIACTRMYNAAPSVTEAWRILLQAASRIGGIPLEVIAHPFPNDIEDLWKRPDLGLAFMCGRAFMLDGSRHVPVAVPLRRAAQDQPFYGTELLVREDSPFHCLEDSFGSRLGWTVHHSHSGFIAVRKHLAPYAGTSLPSSGAPRSGDAAVPYVEVGPLHTPARCLAALRENTADVVPLDAYYAELLRRNAPGALDGTRVLDRTRSYPMPLLVASPGVSPAVCGALRQGLFTACAEPENKAALDALCISGFAEPDISLYASLLEDGIDDEPDGVSAKKNMNMAQAAATPERSYS